MFSHIMIGSNDVARSKKFYDALFAAMGAQPGVEDTSGTRLTFGTLAALARGSNPVQRMEFRGYHLSEYDHSHVRLSK